ncbi:unnamed protein product [Psylliodes chrysocephalus]|uniref:Uncharacterized protein n=1 Tax=Psylliodes chrysocephalus TaxID=3402493 RepID=A0A9P0D5I8_9CUCU|nr:unnamed protein product [Psylliodes chrysocephala]
MGSNWLLFSDGCSGQNKNSITATMLLCTVANSKNIEEISLRFFESFHGQNEEDSAHSAISTALTTAGDIFVPSQLHPIIRLARRKQPYKVIPLEYHDFIDFKKLSRDQRILSVRTSDYGNSIKWTDIMELKFYGKLSLRDAEAALAYLPESNIEEEYETNEFQTNGNESVNEEKESETDIVESEHEINDVDSEHEIESEKNKTISIHKLPTTSIAGKKKPKATIDIISTQLETKPKRFPNQLEQCFNLMIIL